MPIIRRSDCVPLPTVVCPVVAVVMLESRLARCVDCVTLSGNILHTVHTFCQPTLQHRNSYNRTDNCGQWNAVGSPDDGYKDARNLLRYYWLQINHYLLHLVGLTFTYLSRMHGHSNIKSTSMYSVTDYIICSLWSLILKPRWFQTMDCVFWLRLGPSGRRWWTRQNFALSCETKGNYKSMST